jgi:hypothetical protein
MGCNRARRQLERAETLVRRGGARIRPDCASRCHNRQAKRTTTTVKLRRDVQQGAASTPACGHTWPERSTPNPAIPTQSRAMPNPCSRAFDHRRRTVALRRAVDLGLIQRDDRNASGRSIKRMTILPPDAGRVSMSVTKSATVTWTSFTSRPVNCVRGLGLCAAHRQRRRPPTWATGR